MTTTLAPYIGAYMKSRRALGIYGPKSQRVVGPRLHSLARSYGNRPLAHLTPAAIERWLDSISHLSQNTRACYLVSVRQFTAWLTTQRHIDVDPCVPIPPVKRPKPLPRALPGDAIAAILDACRTDQERAIIWLMVGLGLRRMEVAGLRWDHYDERSGLLEVRSAKNGKPRILPMTNEVARALLPLRRHGSTGPIVRNVRDDRPGPMTAERVGLTVSQIMTRAGIRQGSYDGNSGHALRHTCASDVLDECGDLRIVQALLGHENLSTTAIYLRRHSAAEMRAAMEGRTYRAEGDQAA